jgi:tRNA-Thr(GGU) m(6)t(6)A37 methyltransferase TsaA
LPAGHKINLTPIGVVRNSVNKSKHRDWQAVVSEIVINDELEAALDGLEGFSHLIVVYWMHKLPSPKEPPMKVHPKGDQSLPLTGVFATRSPTRPNPIGVTVVRLLRRHKNVLEVRGLDALNGTPVLDIKPYIPTHDSVNDATIPQWLR